MSKHSKYGPSGANRWTVCPGSVDLIPHSSEDRGSIYAMEGTVAHDLIHRSWILGTDPHQFVGQTIGEFEVTGEMADGAQLFLDTVASMVNSDCRVEMEIRVLHEDYPDFGGTIDCLITNDRDYTAIVDYKYGQGVTVNPDENIQLSCYAILATQKDIQDVHLCIVQPRVPHDDGPVRRWIASREYLCDLWDTVIHPAFSQKHLASGPHCHWCPAKANCPVLKEEAMGAAKEVFNPDKMTPELAQEILSKSKQIRDYLTAVFQWAQDSLEKGREVPGYKLVNTYANRKYAFPEEEIVKRCKSKKFGKRKIYKTSLLPPAQLEKVIGKDIIDSLVERPFKGVAMVPESDKRPAVGAAGAREAFNEENQV